MATGADVSSSPTCCSYTVGKPVIVRVKRKSSQAPLDAFWLEINERPRKRRFIDFNDLLINDSTAEEGDVSCKKVLVQHVESAMSSTDAFCRVQSLMSSNDDGIIKLATEERRKGFKKLNIKQEIMLKARQNHEELTKNARFEQIWSRRKENEEASKDKSLYEMCHFYDVLRVDAEEMPNEVLGFLSLEDQRILHSYLTLVREQIPNAAAQLEREIQSCVTQGDYVYDYYTEKSGKEVENNYASISLPHIQVEKEEFYDGLDDASEYDTDDSNAELHPRNDYPDEMSDELESEAVSNSTVSEEDYIDDDDDDDDHDKGLKAEDYLSCEDEKYLYESFDDDSFDDNYGDDDDFD